MSLNRDKKVRKRLIFDCEVCGEKTELSVSWKKYCSDECRVFAWALGRIRVRLGNDKWEYKEND